MKYNLSFVVCHLFKTLATRHSPEKEDQMKAFVLIVAEVLSELLGRVATLKNPRYSGFTFHRQWADESRADYGLEGGKSLPYLAYLKINNQRCLYNVWSFLGRDHLEYLLQHLRFVKGAP